MRLRVTEVKSRLKKLKELGDFVFIDEKKYEIDYNEVISALSLKDKDSLPLDSLDEIVKNYLVKSNLLFADPLNNLIKPQYPPRLTSHQKGLKIG